MYLQVRSIEIKCYKCDRTILFRKPKLDQQWLKDQLIKRQWGMSSEGIVLCPKCNEELKGLNIAI